MISHPDTASSTSVGTAEPPAEPSAPSTSAAWIGGGAAWVAAGLIFADDGWRSTAASVTWFVADLLLLAALVGLHRRRLHGGSKVGSVASSMAMLARALFAVGEVVTIASGHDEGPLIPLGALLTAVALTAYGITVLRRPGDVGPVGWALLATGLYPFVAMFPVLAVTGEPNHLLIALWGVPTMAVGSCLHGGRRRSRSGGERSEPTHDEQAIDLAPDAGRLQRRRRLGGAIGAVLVLATSTIALADGGPAAADDDGDVLLEHYDPLPTTVEYGQDLVFEGAATDLSQSCLVVPFDCDEPEGYVYLRPADEERLLATAVLQPFLQGNRDLSFWGPMVLGGQKLGPGTHDLFLGIESNFRPVEYPFTLVVRKIACAIDLRQSTPSSNPNEPVSFTATIGGNGDHSGQLVFRDQNGDLLANPTIANGLATFTTSALPQGTTTVTASWAGNDVIYDRCSAAVSHTVANDPNPVAVDDTYQVDAGRTVVALPLENDFDLGPGPLRVEYLDSPELGEVVAFADGAQLQYTAPEDLVGEDRLRYVAYDGSGQASNEATITFFIGCEPEAADDQYSVAFGTPLTVAGPGVYANDGRCDLPTTLLTPPAHGTVSYDGQGGGFTYTPDPGFVGRDSFTYRYGQAGDDPTDGTVRLRIAPPVTTTTTTTTATPTSTTSVPPSSTTTTPGTTTTEPTTTTTSTPGSTTTAPTPTSTTTSVPGPTTTTSSVPATTSTVPPTTGGPTITAVDPGSGRAGDLITVTGSNFVAGNTTVTVGGIAAAAEVESSRAIGGRLRFAVPTGAALGEGLLTVTTPLGTTSSTTPFTVLGAPTATTSPPGAPSTTGPPRPDGGSGAVQPGGAVSDGTLPRTGSSLGLLPLAIGLLAGGLALLALRRRSLRHL